MITYETIKELLAAPEGEHYEFKEAKNRFDFQEAVKYCCALYKKAPVLVNFNRYCRASQETKYSIF